jgi:hypothetical protein
LSNDRQCQVKLGKIGLIKVRLSQTGRQINYGANYYKVIMVDFSVTIHVTVVFLVHFVNMIAICDFVIIFPNLT